jgi:hypothetical protein
METATTFDAQPSAYLREHRCSLPVKVPDFRGEPAVTNPALYLRHHPIDHSPPIV